ncbi:hypothetical protein [Altericroceibacterium xinjiangense]|uniref:hypothetical protein n=1 Tax=Altericroceibacterium xinjiangense TaxID=762261 RepID=UPI000F7E2D68|nr:hypothetical protein [Altericroceibacterium xinjiangense]
MPLWLYAALLGLCAVTTLIAGIWLLLHLRDVARMFRRHEEITPGPGPRRASSGAVWVALALFNAGWIGAVVLWVFSNTERAQGVVHAAV